MNPILAARRRIGMFLVILAVALAASGPRLAFGDEPGRGGPRPTPSPTPVSAAAAAAAAAPDEEKARFDIPGLSSALARLVVAQRAGTLAAAATAQGVALEGDRVLVTVEAARGRGAGAAAAAGGQGGRVTAQWRDQLDVRLPVAALAALAKHADVVRIDLPQRPVPAHHTTSQGVALSNVPAWRTAGLDGSGVKVGIIDFGFQGYQTRLGTDLPAAVDTSCALASRPLENGNNHGLTVAEVIHDIAPAASLSLVAIGSNTELGVAADCLVQRGVHVINLSGNWVVDGPGDGVTGTSTAVVNATVARGVFWVNSAGNFAEKHRAEDIYGAANRTRVFTEYVQAQPGETLDIALRWSDTWGQPCKDYDLYLYNPAGTSVAGGWNYQTCQTSQRPTEVARYMVPAGQGGRYRIDVYCYANCGRATRVELFSASTNQNLHRFTAPTPAGSIAQPADSNSAGMVSVGAVHHADPRTVLPYSSQGPTVDGRYKPDLVAPAEVTTSLGNFTGTSAAAPHVTGAAALVTQYSPQLRPDQLKDYLLANATQYADLETYSWDNKSGAGRLYLGPLPAGFSATRISQPCSSTGQLCSPAYSRTVQTGSTVDIQFTADSGHCSDIRVHVAVDGVVRYTSPFLSASQSTGRVALGAVTPGSHTISVQAEGRVGGCNPGSLGGWGGALAVWAAP